jgi:hypothetical protein
MISEGQRQKLVEKGVKTIQNASTPKQIDFIENAVKSGGATYSRMGTILRQNAPIEMRKGIAKFAKEGRPLTVDALLEDYRSDKSFQKLALNAGCDEQYFIDLAEQELKAYNGRYGGEICPLESTKQQAQVQEQLAVTKPESGVHKLLRKLHLS